MSDMRLVEKVITLSHAAGVPSPFPSYRAAKPEDDTGEHFGAVIIDWKASGKGGDRIRQKEMEQVMRMGQLSVDTSGTVEAILKSARERAKRREALSAALRSFFSKGRSGPGTQEEGAVAQVSKPV